MKREEDLEQSTVVSQSTNTLGRSKETTYGVQSLADTLETAFGPESASPSHLVESRSPQRLHGKSASRTYSHSSAKDLSRSPESSKSSPARKSKRKLSNYGYSIPPPLSNVDASITIIPNTIPSTPKSVSLQSMKSSDEDSALDEVASQAIMSSGEEEEQEEVDTQAGASLQSFPQLVMPSIRMPTRRPFTIKGKAMGKLKVMVAGETGAGKTSFIRSILQVCEDIVHFDPLSPPLADPPRRSKARRERLDLGTTRRIVEIHASTKPYPHWWTDLEESRILRRRKSGIDEVLERNISFVDTPGFTQDSSDKDEMDAVVEYVESLLYQTSSVATLDDVDLLGVVSGSGGVLVDVIFYLLTPKNDISKDIEFMQRLSSLTNVIPVIAKCDTMSSLEIIASKTSLLAGLQTAAIKPFLFGKQLDDALLAAQGLSITREPETPRASEPNVQLTADSCPHPFDTPTYPYAVSSTPGPDSENMDASLLMSADYVQPLLPSELTALIEQVFDPDSISWLRHTAAKKFLTWRHRTRLPGDSFILHSLQQIPQTPTTASVGLNGPVLNTSASCSMFSATSPSGVLVPRSGSPFYSSNLQSPIIGSSASLANSDVFEPTAELSLARFNSYGRGEERLSEVRVAKWATDLQRSLRNERDRFEELQRNDRAKWLLDRVGEEVTRGTIVASPGGTPRAEWAVVRHGDEKAVKAGQRYHKAMGLDTRDPLGLCSFGDDVRRNGFVFVKVLGGVSVLGAVVVAVIRAFGLETGLPQGEWWNWLTNGSE